VDSNEKEVTFLLEFLSRRAWVMTTQRKGPPRKTAALYSGNHDPDDHSQDLSDKSVCIIVYPSRRES